MPGFIFGDCPVYGCSQITTLWHKGIQMDCKEIEQRLLEQLQLAEVYVKTDGSHYSVTAVGDCFDGLSRVKQQQLVYAPLMSDITNGSIHALQIKAFTPTQWRREKLLNPPV
jgi:acid stress-induced BolA-like protein IbaG/YrbA